jgi:hypothetical protein
LTYCPSHDRDSQPIDQDLWVDETLKVLGELYGGATAFPRGRGVWRDDARGRQLVFDEPVVVQCYTGEQAIETHAAALRTHLIRMGTETRQRAVGLVIDRDDLEMGFPLEEER